MKANFPLDSDDIFELEKLDEFEHFSDSIYF